MLDSPGCVFSVPPSNDDSPACPAPGPGAVSEGEGGLLSLLLDTGLTRPPREIASSVPPRRAEVGKLFLSFLFKGIQYDEYKLVQISLSESPHSMLS